MMMNKELEFSIKDVDSLFKSNKDAPMYVVENNHTGEQVALCWSRERAEQIIELLDKAENGAATEEGFIYCFTPTNNMTVFTAHLLWTATLRKISEVLLGAHESEKSDDNMRRRPYKPYFLSTSYKSNG